MNLVKHRQAASLARPSRGLPPSRIKRVRAALGFGMAMAWTVMLVSHPAAGGVVTLLNDTFSDGARTNGADALDTAWYAFNGVTAGGAPGIGTDNTAPLSGSTLSFTAAGSSINSWIGGAFAATTLASPGDYLEISYDIRYTSSHSANSGPLVGLFNSNGTPVTADAFGVANNSQNDKGIKVYKNMYATSNDFYIVTQPTLNSMYSWDGTRIQLSSSGLNVNNASAHKEGMRVALAANGTDLLITGWFDGYSTSCTYVNGAVLMGTTFDMAYLCPSGGMNSPNLYVDNILVTAVIPEPAAMALLLLGGGLLAGQRRR